MSTAIKVATATFTRPANTTAYTAGDVVSNSITATTLMKFLNAARFNGQGAYLTKARLWTDKKTETAQYRLYLFAFSESDATTPVSVPVDNAPMTSIYANAALSLGYIDFPAVKDDADTSNSTAAYAEVAPSLLGFKCAGADDSIYGVLVNQTGTTPASAQNFFVALTFDRDTA